MARLSRCVSGAGALSRPSRLCFVSAVFVVLAMLVFLALPLLAAENCTSFDPGIVTAKQVSGSWRVMSGNTTLLNCGASQANAQTAVNVIKSYGMNSKCTAAGLQYWLVSGKAPGGAFAGETSTQFDPAKLNVLQVAGTWWIAAGTKPLLGFGTSQANANEALATIKKYGFNSFCYAGTMPDVMTYFKTIVLVSTRSFNIGPISIPTPDDVINSLTGGSISLPGGISLPLPPLPPGVPSPTGSLAPVVAKSPGGATIVLPPGVPVPPGFTVVSGSSGSNPLAPVLVKAPNGVVIPLPPGVPVPPGFTVVSGSSSSGSNTHAAVPVGSTGNSGIAAGNSLPGNIGIAAGNSLPGPNTGHPVTGSPVLPSPGILPPPTPIGVSHPPVVIGAPTTGSPVTGTPIAGPHTPVVISPPQPPLQEDCIAFNPNSVQASQINGSWKVVQGSMWMLDFGASGEANAKKAADIIKHYNMTSQCFVGRPNPPFQYWLCNGNAPAGPFPGEDRIAFSPASVEAKQIGGRWKIVDGSNWLFDFNTNQAQATYSLNLIKKYGFNAVCFVGRPNAPMMYLRKDIPLMVAPPGFNKPPTTTPTVVRPLPGGIRPIQPGIIRPPLVINPQPGTSTGSTGTTGTTGTTGESTGSPAAPPARPVRVPGGIRPIQPGIIRPPLVIKPQPGTSTGTTGDTTGSTGPSTGTPGIRIPNLTQRPPLGTTLPKTPGVVTPINPGNIEQPVRPLPLQENCSQIDPNAIVSTRVGNNWTVLSGQTPLMNFGSGGSAKQNAKLAVDIIKHYGMTSHCSVGGPNGPFHYWLVNGQSPVGLFAGEDCIPFDPSKLEVKQSGNNWLIVENPSHSMFSFSNQADANKALTIIRKYGFTKTCYVGRPNAPMQYLRK